MSIIARIINFHTKESQQSWNMPCVAPAAPSSDHNLNQTFVDGTSEISQNYIYFNVSDSEWNALCIVLK